MKKLLFALIVLFAFYGQAYSWGFWAHQRINRLAVFTLPPELFGVYKQHIEYLTEHAVDPDKRRYAVEYEAPRHYIDIDHYGEYPFENVPRKWNDAVAKYSEDTLLAYGIVPWHIQRELYRLTEAFKAKDIKRIMKISADIGHYIGDSNVPLHTTENYNGQLTNQKGIHGLWESRLPELFAEEYDFYVGRAQYLEHPLDASWSCVLSSHAALDSVLSFERELSKRFPSDKKYSFENRNNVVTKVYSKEFCREYHDMLSGQVERRMRNAILMIGSFWLTAWINAGQPDMEGSPVAEIEQEEKYEKKLRIIDRESQEID